MTQRTLFTPRRFILWVWLFLLMVPSALAQAPVSPVEAMQAGNQSYENGEYKQAAEIYETIVEAGIEDSTLYYNLGNAYYKQGDLGRAILNYRRAQLLDPRDPEISNNLLVARSQTLDQFDALAESGLTTNLVEVAEGWLTLEEAAILALMLWLALTFFVTIAILFRRLRRLCLWTAAVLGFLLVAGLFSMANRIYTQTTTPAAVVVVRELNVTSGPGGPDQYIVEFNLHAGAEVRLIENRPDWQQISLPGNDFQGWVPADAVEPVVKAAGGE